MCIFSRLQFYQYSIPRVTSAVRKFTPKILHIKVWAGDAVWVTVNQMPDNSRVQTELSKPQVYSSSVNPAHRDRPVTSSLCPKTNSCRGSQDMFGVNFLTENIPLNFEWWIWELIMYSVYLATHLRFDPNQWGMWELQLHGKVFALLLFHLFVGIYHT